MSLSVYMTVEARDKSGKWNIVAPLVPDADGKTVKPADFSFPNGCHEIFSRLGYEHYLEPADGVQYGLPLDVSEGTQTVYDEWVKDLEGAILNTHYINLADLHVDILEHPMLKDEEDYEDPILIENPLKEVYEKAIAWMRVYTSLSWSDWFESDVRIVGWIV